jgi:hypothetical protein
MDRHDDFFLAWLARDARFQASIHFSPKRKLGYKVHRKVYTSMEDEPLLNLWLASKGVHGRVLRDKKEIQKVLSILAPVWDAVKDRANLQKLLLVMDAPSARKMKHTDITDLMRQFEEIV